MLIFGQHLLFSALRCVQKGLVSITQGKGTPWSGSISRGETLHAGDPRILAACTSMGSSTVLGSHWRGCGSPSPPPPSLPPHHPLAAFTAAMLRSFPRLTWELLAGPGGRSRAWMSPECQQWAGGKHRVPALTLPKPSLQPNPPNKPQRPPIPGVPCHPPGGMR